jgi:hypothetical protein
MSDVPSALVGRDLGALHEVPNQINASVRSAGGPTRFAAARNPGAIQAPSTSSGPAGRGHRAVIPTDLLSAPVALDAGWRVVGRRATSVIGEAADLARAERPIPGRQRRRDRGVGGGNSSRWHAGSGRQWSHR